MWVGCLRVIACWRMSRPEFRNEELEKMEELRTHSAKEQSSQNLGHRVLYLTILGWLIIRLTGKSFEIQHVRTCRKSELKVDVARGVAKAKTRSERVRKPFRIISVMSKDPKIINHKQNRTSKKTKSSLVFRIHSYRMNWLPSTRVTLLDLMGSSKLLGARTSNFTCTSA